MSAIELIILEKSWKPEKRYTLSPVYAPNRKDAHNEWVAGTDLEAAMHDFVRKSAKEGRRINLQHGDLGQRTVGEWVDSVVWPYEQTVEMRKANGQRYTATLPAGTVYLGVVWDADIWPLVKSGKLAGYSLGGRAMKVRGAVPVGKAGRVLSQANLDALVAAHEALCRVIQAETGKPVDEAAQAELAKTLADPRAEWYVEQFVTKAQGSRLWSRGSL